MYELNMQFRGLAAPRLFDQIIIHESVTHDKDTTIRVLKNRGLSVHFMVGGDGYVSQLMSLARYAQHAGAAHNKRSIAVEVINPYYGRGEGLEGVWVARSSRDGTATYLVPPLIQLEMTWQLIAALCSATSIPLAFPGFGEKGFRWGRDVQAAAKPGIMAHHRSNHADGLFIEHYCLARSLDVEPEAALALTLDAAQAGTRLTRHLDGLGGLT